MDLKVVGQPLAQHAAHEVHVDFCYSFFGLLAMHACINICAITVLPVMVQSSQSAHGE